MNKDYIKNITNGERRFNPGTLQVEVREGKESRTISGYAAVFNRNSEDFGGWVERVDSGAFNEVLNHDAVALFNHDPNFILARNGVNMTLTVDGVGLRYEFEAPNTTAGNDLLENIRNGNIKQSSFAFTTKEVKWYNPSDKSEPSVRTIMKVERLYDVSPVTYPAYPDTTVAARSFAELQNNNEYLVHALKKRHELYLMSIH